MKKVSAEYLMQKVICPACKKERRQGEMMCGTNKPICKHCWNGGEKNDRKSI